MISIFLICTLLLPFSGDIRYIADDDAFISLEYGTLGILFVMSGYLISRQYKQGIIFGVFTTILYCIVEFFDFPILQDFLHTFGLIVVGLILIWLFKNFKAKGMEST